MLNNEKKALVTNDARILEPERILYVDTDCIVVNKRAGEAVEGAAPGIGDLPRMLNYALKSISVKPARELALPVAVHRLDVPASGCVLFARTQSALAFLNGTFRTRLSQAGTDVPMVEKHYWAVIEKPAFEIPAEAELVHWIAFDPKKNKTRAFDEPESECRTEKPERKQAIMKYRLIGTGTHYLFLDIELITGRHHQIRCQLEHIGLHIKGDLKYGARRSEKTGGIRLHARSLTFPSPLNGTSITVQANPPVLDALWQEFLK